MTFFLAALYFPPLSFLLGGFRHGSLILIPRLSCLSLSLALTENKKESKKKVFAGKLIFSFVFSRSPFSSWVNKTTSLLPLVKQTRRQESKRGGEIASSLLGFDEKEGGGKKESFSSTSSSR